MKKIFFLLVILLSGCHEKEYVDRPFPRLSTLPVTKINKSGAIFNAKLLKRGDQPIIEYGFVWDTQRSLNLEYSNKLTFHQQLEKNEFGAEVNRALDPGEKYFVKAYVKTNDHLVFGDAVTFVSYGSTVN